MVNTQFHKKLICFFLGYLYRINRFRTTGRTIYRGDFGILCRGGFHCIKAMFSFWLMFNIFCLICFLLFLFQEGEIVTVTKINANGQWEGQIGERSGLFPFTHVKFLDENS